MAKVEREERMANQENIQKWVEALRSGEFKQTRQYLADSKGYCCLGVACEIAIRNGVAIRKKPEENSRTGKVFLYDGDGGELPTAAAEWLGLVEEDEDYPEMIPNCNPILTRRDGREYSAADWNDDQELSFAEIADLIEFTYLATSKPDGG